MTCCSLTDHAFMFLISLKRETFFDTLDAHLPFIFTWKFCVFLSISNPVFCLWRQWNADHYCEIPMVMDSSYQYPLYYKWPGQSKQAEIVFKVFLNLRKTIIHACIHSLYLLIMLMPTSSSHCARGGAHPGHKSIIGPHKIKWDKQYCSLN